ncbi:MAG: hypothetical protein JSW66_10405 [Phycisphaerales bacterium]|nr:MAG: hypothetical protein JSW66_10405 [Phycisphaerales bacterium]
MTLESLTNRSVEYVSWLYYGREWAAWELGAVAVTVLILLLLAIRRLRKAKTGEAEPAQVAQRSRIIGARLAAGRADHHQAEEFRAHHLASLSKRDGKKRRWKQTAKELKGFGTLVEQLQIEVSRYKVAEESFKQQLVKLKAANERLRQELAAKAIGHSDLSSAGPLARFGKQQHRVLDGR